MEKARQAQVGLRRALLRAGRDGGGPGGQDVGGAVEAVVMVGTESSYRYFAAHRKPRGTPARSIASCPCHIATRATSRKGYPRGFLARHQPRFAAP